MSIIANPKRPKRELHQIRLEEIGVPAAYAQLWADAGQPNNLQSAYDALLSPVNWVERLDGTTVVDLSLVDPALLVPQASDSIEKALLAYSGRPEEIDELFGLEQTGEKATSNPQVTETSGETSEGFIPWLVRFLSGGEYTVESDK